jgi:membrane protein implicated in regulation of membrane protease activity
VNALAVVFLSAFIAGLVLAVFAMLHGVEHARASRSEAPSAFFNLPAFGAFGVGFGAVGYLLASRTRLPTWAIVLIAAGAGALTISAMITLLARWALREFPGDSAAAAEEIQGHFAVVTRDISPTNPGEIRYELHGREMRVPAKGLTAKNLAMGEEVVIDRIEDGIAMVEQWSVVEQRL